VLLVIGIFPHLSAGVLSSGQETAICRLVAVTPWSSTRWRWTRPFDPYRSVRFPLVPDGVAYAGAGRLDWQVPPDNDLHRPCRARPCDGLERIDESLGLSARSARSIYAIFVVLSGVWGRRPFRRPDAC